MSILDINKIKAEKFDKLEDSALDILQEYFDGTRQGSDEIPVARAVLSTVAKNRVTTTARDALKFNMVNSITDDPKILRKYVKASQPEIKKLL